LVLFPSNFADNVKAKFYKLAKASKYPSGCPGGVRELNWALSDK
jgi:hypothetical protein